MPTHTETYTLSSLVSHLTYGQTTTIQEGINKKAIFTVLYRWMVLPLQCVPAGRVYRPGNKGRFGRFWQWMWIMRTQCTRYLSTNRPRFVPEAVEFVIKHSPSSAMLTSIKIISKTTFHDHLQFHHAISALVHCVKNMCAIPFFSNLEATLCETHTLSNGISTRRVFNTKCMTLIAFPSVWFPIRNWKVSFIYSRWQLIDQNVVCSIFSYKHNMTEYAIIFHLYKWMEQSQRFADATLINTTKHDNTTATAEPSKRKNFDCGVLRKPLKKINWFTNAIQSMTFFTIGLTAEHWWMNIYVF